jgi:hypothetical protein
MRQTFLIFFLLLPLQAGASDKPKWKDLFDGKSLTGWKACDFANAGKSHVKDGAIVLEKGKSMTGVLHSWKGLPTMDYEVEVEARLVEGRDFFAAVTFPVGKTHCTFVPGGWSGNVTGLSTVDFADASLNETRREVEYKKGQWYTFRIRVTRERIQCWVDKERVVDLESKGRDIGLRIECRACRPFGIASYETVGAIRAVRVRPLEDAEKKGR